MRADIERFKGQGVEMEEKRKDILRGLEVSECPPPAEWVDPPPPPPPPTPCVDPSPSPPFPSLQAELANVGEQTADYERRHTTATSTLDQLKTGHNIIHNVTYLQLLTAINEHGS